MDGEGHKIVLDGESMTRYRKSVGGRTTCVRETGDGVPLVVAPAWSHFLIDNPHLKSRRQLEPWGLEPPEGARPAAVLKNAYAVEWPVWDERDAVPIDYRARERAKAEARIRRVTENAYAQADARAARLEEARFRVAGMHDECLCVVPPEGCTLVVDTETTGLDPKADEVLSVGICTLEGEAVYFSYFKPYRRRSWPEAEAINGIMPESLRTFGRIYEHRGEIADVLARASRVVMYNAAFDTAFLEAAGVPMPDGVPVEDAMLTAAYAWGTWDRYHGDFRWLKLTRAAELAGHDWGGAAAHGSLADAMATATVRRWLDAHPEAVERGREFERRALAGDFDETDDRNDGDWYGGEGWED